MYSGNPLFWHCYLQLSFVYKTVSQISFKLFCLGDKRLLSEFLRKWGWFQGHSERFLNILAKNSNFKKLRHSFVDETALITTTLISSCHWKSLVPCTKETTWKRIFNTNSKLQQNRTEKQIMPSKTTLNWLFNDIWCYLFIAFFRMKRWPFSIKVVRVYYIFRFSF